jgi:hypothetical protein
MEKQNNTAVAETKSKELSLEKTNIDYMSMINANPRQKWLKVNRQANNALYIPIGIYYELLNKIFPMWQIEQVGEVKLIGNSVVVTVHLKVFHPVYHEWLTYAGTGAVPIQVKAGSNPTDFSNIIGNALHKNVPAAMAYAVKNAAAKIGRVFGSQLNKTDEI